MNRERWFQIAEIFSRVTDASNDKDTLCSRCRELLSVAATAISLTTAGHMTTLCGSDERMVTLEELQFTVGEGPTIEAFTSGRPVIESNLADALSLRWPQLAGVAADVGLRGVFSYPLQIGAARIGALTLYQERTTGLSPGQLVDATIAADVLAHVLVSLQAHLPDEILAASLESAVSLRAETHQASGMLSEQLHVTVAEALVLLRARSYASTIPVADLAASVIGRHLSLERAEDLQIKWVATA